MVSGVWARGTRLLRTSTALAGASGLAILTALALPSPARANPEDGTVAAGAATIQANGPGRLDVIQSTPRAVIDWKRFGILEGEHTHFQQPDANAVTLNRVTGADPSAILGRLTANGQIWLVNPNGILFGPNARVDVGGLVATTHDIRNDDFMAGRDRFEGRAGSTATVENEGRITVATAGLAALVAPGVANRGTIEARLGEVALASGRRFVVDLFGDQKINLATDAQGDAKTDARPVGADGKPVGALVSNSGKIFADGGRVRMSASAAKGLVDRVVNMSGTVQARSAEQRDGEIVLLGEGGAVEVSGTLDASGLDAGRKGGSVTVSGERTTLATGARVDARGSAGGGAVRIGGDVQGGKADAATLAGYTIRPARKPVPPSITTVVAEGAAIDADATGNGRGGTVVVWAEDTARFDGTIRARGGAAGGDGGFIETSGALTLQVRGRADAGAAAGKAGSWLLDPSTITIQAGGPDSIPGGGTLDPGGASSSVSGATIAASLASTDVVIQTASGSGGMGDIVVDDAIVSDTASARSLTLKASRDVVVNKSIRSASGPLTVVLHANAESNGNGAVRLAGASGAPVEIVTNGGDFIVGGGANPLVNPALGYNATDRHVGVWLSHTQVATGGGTIRIAGNGGQDSMSGGADGIRLTDSTLSSDGGGILMTGQGAVSAYGDGNHGIRLSGSALSTTSGSIVLSGTALNNSRANNVGLLLDDTTLDASTTGTIALTGIGGNGNGAANHGIHLKNGSVVTVTDGAATLSGTGGNGTAHILGGAGDANSDNNIGVFVEGATVRSVGGGGQVTVTGIGGDAQGAGNQGIRLTGGTAIATTAGAILLSGRGGDGANTTLAPSDGNIGVLIEGATVQAGSGFVTVDGTGGTAGGVDNHGVHVLNGATIATDGGAISLQGTGVGGDRGYNVGVKITTSAVTSSSGAIDLNGAGGHDGGLSSPGNNVGVDLAGAVLRTAGNITLHGQGGSSSGGADNDAIRVASATQIRGLGNGALTMTTGAGLSDRIVLDDSVLSFNLGTLSLTAGADLTVTNHATIEAPTTLLDAAGGLALSDATVTGALSLTLRAGYDISLTGTTLTAMGGDILLNANRGGASEGAIQLFNSAARSGGGAITLGGGATPATKGANGSSGTPAGVTLADSELNSAGGAIGIIGEGHGAADQSHGVAITGASTIEAGTGTIAIQGTARSNYGWNAGVLIDAGTAAGVLIRSASTAGTAIRISGNAQGVNADEGWGTLVRGTVTIAATGTATGTGGIVIAGTGGASAVTATVAGIGLDAGTGAGAGVIDVSSRAGQVTLDGIAGTGTNAVAESRAGTVRISGAPAGNGGSSGTVDSGGTASPPASPPAPPTVVPPPPVSPPVPPPVSPPAVSPPVAPVSPPPPPAVASPPAAPVSPPSSGAQTAAGSTAVQAALQTVARIAAGTPAAAGSSSPPDTAAGRAAAGTAGTPPGGATAQTFLAALEQPATGTGTSSPAGGAPAPQPASPTQQPPAQQPPALPPGPATVALASGRAVTFSAEATAAYGAGATLSQPGPQTLALPQVQAAAGAMIQAAGGGGMVQAVTALATGGLSPAEQRAVLASVPVAALIGGLTQSGDPVAAGVGAILQNTANGAPGGYAAVRAALAQANVAPEVTRAYLAMVQRVQREQRTETLRPALRQLIADPHAADMFGRPGAAAAPASLRQARGGRTRGGTMTLRGIVADSANLAEARVNGRWVFIDEQGQFRTSIPVEPGATEATLTMTGEDGITTEQRIQLDPATASAEPAAPPKPRRIALMIAVEKYSDGAIPALMTPGADIQAVGRTLADRLGYETRVLRNPTKAQIGDALRRLGREVGEQDQVMVYYAGHGYELAETGTGYWLPADAETTSARNWVSNNDVGRFLSRMPAKHVMVVSDSCYSGAFTKEQKIDASKLASGAEMRQRRSVMALSSGGDEPVADGEVNSPFATALTKRVAGMPRDSNGYALYQEIHADVTREAPQTPQYGVIKAAGYDEGGDFLLEMPAAKAIN